jgi:AAA+ ATPase superfamily predicted ATPase
MKLIAFNPYIVGNPIKSREMFFGREDDFQFVVKKIGEGRTNQIVVLCGERRSGKTSILFQILGGRLGPQFLPVLIDMQMLAGIKGDYDFFRAVVRAGLGALELDAHEADSLESAAGAAGVERFFESFLSLAAQRAPNKIVLFLLDEYELIEAKIKDGSLSESTIHYLGGIIESPHKVSFIFTGSTNLEDRKAEVWKSLLGKSIYRKISYLSRNDTYRLITEPLKDVVSYPAGLLDSIYRLTGGQPFYTQVVCQNMVDLLMESEKTTPDGPDLERIVRDIVDNPLPQMIYSWNSVAEWDQIILASLASRLVDPEKWADAVDIVRFIRDNRIILPFKRERVNVLLEETYHKEFLEKSDSGEYRFKMDLFRRWIKREHSIWKVAKEAKLEFQKGIKPLLIVAAAAAFVLGFVAITWFIILPRYRGPAAVPGMTAGIVSAAENPANPPKAVQDVRFSANRGPFRLQIDDKQTLTSEGQSDPRSIVVSTMEPGRHVLNATLVGGGSKSIQIDVSLEKRAFTIEFAPAQAKSVATADSATITAQPVQRDTPANPASEKPTGEQPPPAKSEQAAGFLILNSKPSGAEVFLDGIATGKKTPYAESVTAGEHSIALDLTGYKRLTAEVSVEKGGKAAPEYALDAVYGEIRFDVRPTAKISIDGVYALDTPYDNPWRVQAGAHVVTIVNEALNVTKKVSVEVKEGETVLVKEILK